MLRYQVAVELAKRQWLLAGMRECGGCVRKFAQRSGVHRAYLYKLLRKYAPEVPRIPLPMGERKRCNEHRATGGNADWRALDEQRPEVRA